jgi:sigma-54 specific flagellar transcriptional regulator A
MGEPATATYDSEPACEVTAVRQTSRGRLVARSAKMLAAVDLLERVAKAGCTVLVTGESGTGKELAVGLLHDASGRRGRELVAVNCGAIPENLVESELFGHARGAFTGAHAARRGLVAAAEGGTLFLDEIESSRSPRRPSCCASSSNASTRPSASHAP